MDRVAPLVMFSDDPRGSVMIFIVSITVASRYPYVVGQVTGTIGARGIAALMGWSVEYKGNLVEVRTRPLIHAIE